MSRVIAAYDLDEDHGRLWVNANLKRMPDIVIVANQPMDRAQTVTYVPEARLLEAIDENRRVEAENTKLRELVRDLWKACPADDYYCIYHCEHYDKESESHCKLKDRMARAVREGERW